MTMSTVWQSDGCKIDARFRLGWLAVQIASNSRPAVPETAVMNDDSADARQ